MKPKEAVEFFGTQARLARAVGAAPSSVAEWLQIGYIPEGRQYQIELATGGLLKADLPACRVNDCQEVA